MDVAVVEAGLGGRFDATNVLETQVVLLTNVGLEHTEVLGETVEAIATEKLAVARPGAFVILPEPRYAAQLPAEASSGGSVVRRRLSRRFSAGRSTVFRT